MKKYGLNLRIPPSGNKKPAPAISKPPLRPPAFAFGDDDDDVEREISRHAAKNKALQKVEEQHKKALEEDPSVFDYDGVYDDMKEQIARPKIQDRAERKSKYIETLMQKAKEREREHEIIYERKQIKERNKDDHLFVDKEKFVTSAYKKKLAEREQWLEEERLRQLREEKEDVTKKKDLSEFYFGLSNNVAFGAPTRLKESTEPSKHEPVSNIIQDTVGVKTRSEAPVQDEDGVGDRAEAHRRSRDQFEHSATTSETAVVDTTSAQETEKVEDASAKQTSELYKRGEDKLAAARERFLARKKAREQ
ncbi:nuclear speckle splicing regulatory protein 1-like [Iris pallida]|uniref:Nuclear speckle splicing regulatory protein 1-like n=1 Tax=Iris pallida TaxID=29817 RepID=A0AAX6FIB6_IRIPA|nr:nuclear speckle splicing regulatory protein 1-like [Iris pallida]KAJ6821071.1 nuclear speckle splicing regulatory protein 1-like [Iris pallida]